MMKFSFQVIDVVFHDNHYQVQIFEQMMLNHPQEYSIILHDYHDFQYNQQVFHRKCLIHFHQ